MARTREHGEDEERKYRKVVTRKERRKKKREGKVDDGSDTFLALPAAYSVVGCLLPPVLYKISSSLIGAMVKN